MILDIMMPGMDGWEFCRQLREQTELPLLMLTAKGEPSQIVKGFELGTDDYLVKPFDPMVLVARVKALLKRYQIMTSQTVQIADITLRRDTFECRVGDQEITLPLKEFELLFKLAGYPGKTFTRDQLIEQIWGYDYDGDERTVDVHIKRLRDRVPEERSKEHQFWTELMEAIRRISRGDFHVNIQPHFGERNGSKQKKHPLHQLVIGISVARSGWCARSHHRLGCWNR